VKLSTLLVHSAPLGLDGQTRSVEHQFAMESGAVDPRLVHRTARIRLRVTRRQADRCYGLLRSAGDLWAWLLDTNRERLEQGAAPIVGYQALCRELTTRGPAGELSVVGARSVLGRYSDAWFQAAKRRRKGEPAGFPRRKRLLVPVRFHHQTFQLDGQRVRLPVARGRPALWVRIARPIPYPAAQVRAVTLVADGGQLWLAVTAAVAVQQHDLDPDRVAGVDLGIIHPYAVVAEQVGLLVSGRAIRAESFLHLRDQQARQAKTARRAPRPGQRGSRRWRRYRARLRRVEARHRRRVPKPSGRRFRCPACSLHGHRDLVGAANIAATLGGGAISATLPTLVEHRRAGIVPARRDRRRHLHDQRRRQRSCLASGHPDGHKGSSGCRSSHATAHPASGEDQATRPNRANVA